MGSSGRPPRPPSEVMLRHSLGNKNEINNHKLLLSKLEYSVPKDKSGGDTPGPWERQLALDRSSLGQIQMEEARACWRASTQRVYESGNKNGKLLYWLATGPKASPIIPFILDEKGEKHEKAIHIAQIFATYYKELYAKRPRSRAEMERSIVWDFSLPTLTPSQAARLDLPITVDEINEATRAIKSGRTPGPDGLPDEFYRTFEDMLSLLLL